MNFSSVWRSVCFRGVSVLLLLYSCCDCSTVINITAKAGHPALLPCSCPSALTPFFIWQKVIGEDEEVVNMYPNHESQIGEAYQNRTQLNIQTVNCSLVFSSVRLSNDGLYKCYYNKIPLRYEEIHLTVTAVDRSMVCNRSDGVYHCQLTELHPEEIILWRLDDQLLPLSVQCSTDPNTGLCDVSDYITLNGNNTAKLTCEVTNTKMNNTVTICKPDSGPVTQKPSMTSLICGFLTIVIVMAAVYVGITCRKQQRKRVATFRRNSS